MRIPMEEYVSGKYVDLPDAGSRLLSPILPWKNLGEGPEAVNPMLARILFT